MNEIDETILSLLDELLKSGKVAYQKDFCAVAGMQNPRITDIRKGVKHFTPLHIQNICREYGINANYIFKLSTRKYI